MSDPVQFFAVLVGVVVLLTALIAWITIRGRRRDQDEAPTITYTVMVGELRIWGLILVVVNFLLLILSGSLAISSILITIPSGILFIVLFFVIKDAAMFMFYCIILIGAALFDFVFFIFAWLEGGYDVWTAAIFTFIIIVIRLLWAAYFLRRFETYHDIQTEYLTDKYGDPETGLRASQGAIDFFPRASSGIGLIALLAAIAALFGGAYVEVLTGIARWSGLIAVAMSVASFQSRYPRTTLSISGVGSGLMALVLAIFFIMPGVGQIAASKDPIPVSNSWILASPAAMPNDQFARQLVVDGQTIIAGYGASEKDPYIIRLGGQGWEWNVVANPYQSGHFGSTIAADGDTIVVGDINSNDLRVYIFNGEAWLEQDRLVSSTDSSSENYGAWAAISGDTIAVGVPPQRESITSAYTDESGTVIIFTRENGNWSQQARIEAPKGSQKKVGFGSQFALDQDTLVIAAARMDERAVAYVYQRSEGDWELRATLDSGEYIDDMIYGSVDISGNRIVVGTQATPYDDLPPAVIYEDISRNGDWSKVAQSGVPRPEDMFYTPTGEVNQPGSISTKVAIDGDQIAFAGVKQAGSNTWAELGTAYLSTFEKGRWYLTYQLTPPDNAPLTSFFDFDFDSGLVVISGFDSQRVGQIIVYDLTGTNSSQSD